MNKNKYKLFDYIKNTYGMTYLDIQSKLNHIKNTGKKDDLIVCMMIVPYIRHYEHSLNNIDSLDIAIKFTTFYQMPFDKNFLYNQFYKKYIILIDIFGTSITIYTKLHKSIETFLYNSNKIHSYFNFLNNKLTNVNYAEYNTYEPCLNMKMENTSVILPLTYNYYYTVHIYVYFHHYCKRI